jgi:bifunctional non-homologous end joining protein LigD
VTLPVPGSTMDRETIDFVVVEELATLVWLANLAALELHVHQWTVDAQDHPVNPNRLVSDLDPGEPAGLGECAQVALVVRDRLAQDGLTSVPVTSGSKGLHLYAGLDRSRTAEEVRDYAKAIAEELEKEHPLVISQMTKARRRGKVFLDWSQNVGSKTTISPYSLRGRDLPTVAAPRTWAEVEDGAEDALQLEHLRLEEVLTRVREQGDLFTLPE